MELSCISNPGAHGTAEVSRHSKSLLLFFFPERFYQKRNCAFSSNEYEVLANLLVKSFKNAGYLFSNEMTYCSVHFSIQCLWESVGKALSGLEQSVIGFTEMEWICETQSSCPSLNRTPAPPLIWNRPGSHNSKKYFAIHQNDVFFPLKSNLAACYPTYVQQQLQEKLLISRENKMLLLQPAHCM